MTEWREIPGLDGRYEASADGRIRSTKSGRILKSHIGRAGYPVVGIYFSHAGRSKHRFVHRLVCVAWHGVPPNNRMEVAHLDGSRTNASASNLRWATAEENWADRKRHGRTSPPRGEQQGAAKLTTAQVIQIRNIYNSGQMKQIDIARMFGVRDSTISRIITGVRWGHVKQGISR